MEINKIYAVNEHGETTDKSRNPGINMYKGSWFLHDGYDRVDNYPNYNSIWCQCYTKGQDMRTVDNSYAHLWNEPVVSVETIRDTAPTWNGIYYVKPLKAGTFYTKTQHDVAGDKTYQWNFVDTNYGG